MILPTKRIKKEYSLIGIGGELLGFLSEPNTVSRLWHNLKKSYEEKSREHPISFEWFVLSLDLLYAFKAIELSDGLIRKTKND